MFQINWDFISMYYVSFKCSYSQTLIFKMGSTIYSWLSEPLYFQTIIKVIYIQTSVVGLGDSMNISKYRDSIAIRYHLSLGKLLSDSN